MNCNACQGSWVPPLQDELPGMKWEEPLMFTARVQMIRRIIPFGTIRWAWVILNYTGFSFWPEGLIPRQILILILIICTILLQQRAPSNYSDFLHPNQPSANPYGCGAGIGMLLE